MVAAWSDRHVVNTIGADAAAVVNVVAGDAQTFIVASTGAKVKITQAASLDGDWQSARTLQTNATPAVDLSDVEAYGSLLGGRVGMVSVGGGTVRFWSFDAGSWKQQGSVVNVYDPFGSPRFPAIAYHPHTWRFFVATWHGAKTILSTSPDRGATWHDGKDIEGTVWVADVDGLQYPNIWCGAETLYMVGYLPGTYHGAAGKCMLYRYEVGNDIVAKGSAVTVGACDEGRPAIIMRPHSKVLTVIVPKTSAAWDDVTDSRSGIVEYRSFDTGATWKLQDELHAIE